ncbi:FAD binding domain-containing protein [Phycomyces nitens]|nr:FAD binding domain-containing protein [Phycomyces nitens]
MEESEVLIVGAGPVGLYTALVLSRMGISVRIIDKADNLNTTNPAVLWAPRSLQLFQSLGVANQIINQGLKHWRFYSFKNKGHGSSAMSFEPYNYRVWDNTSTEYDWCLSCESSQICAILQNTLMDQGVRVEYGHELIDFEDETINMIDTHSLNSSFVDPSIQSFGFANNTQSFTPSGEDEVKILSTIRDVQTGKVHDWRSRIIIGADGTKSFVRQKLGLAQRGKDMHMKFYTLEASVTTNFPGTRTMSTVSKDKYMLMVIGHRDKMYFVFEQVESWSHLPMDENVPLAIAQQHIRSVMEPYQIDFGHVYSYYSWKAGDKASEEVSVDQRYFLLGGAAQQASPPNLFSANPGLEQASNLSWKLFLHLRKRASPDLLDTFDSEFKSKHNDTVEASYASMSLISSSTMPGLLSGLNSTRRQETSYQLQRNENQLMGESSYGPNLINHGSESTISLGSASIDSMDIMEIMVAMAASNICANEPKTGAVGSLAPNAKLKPYTLLQLLSQTQTTEAVKTVEYPRSPSVGMIVSTSTKTSDNPMVGTRPRRSRSQSNVSANPTWSFNRVGPMLKKAIGTNSLVKSSSQPLDENDTLTACPMTTTSGIERWKSIKTNSYQLRERIVPKGIPVTFTVLVFCGSLADQENVSMLRSLKHRIDDPNSFFSCYENSPHVCQPLVDESQSFPSGRPQSPSSVSDAESRHSGENSRSSFSSESSQRSSTSSRSLKSTSKINSITTAPFSQATIPPTSPVSSVLSPVLSAQISPWSNSLDLPRTSITSTSTISTEKSHQLFNFIYITTSTKTQVSKFLSDTPPSVVNNTFPCSLSNVYLDHDQQCHSAYSIPKPTIVVVRPDGYIGTRVKISEHNDIHKLNNYFDAFLRPSADMFSAAAVVAADYY